MSTSSNPNWFERRRNRVDMAVLGVLLQGNACVRDIQHRIGGGSGTIYPALDRLERRRLIVSIPPRTVHGLTEYTLNKFRLQEYLETFGRFS